MTKLVRTVVDSDSGGITHLRMRVRQAPLARLVPPHRLHRKRARNLEETNNIRVLSVAFFVLASLVQAQAQEAPRSPAETSKGSAAGLRNVCAYTISAYPQEVPAGGEPMLARRIPALLGPQIRPPVQPVMTTPECQADEVGAPTRRRRPRVSGCCVDTLCPVLRIQVRASSQHGGRLVGPSRRISNICSFTAPCGRGKNAKIFGEGQLQ